MLFINNDDDAEVVLLFGFSSSMNSEALRGQLETDPVLLNLKTVEGVTSVHLEFFREINSPNWSPVWVVTGSVPWNVRELIPSETPAGIRRFFSYQEASSLVVLKRFMELMPKCYKRQSKQKRPKKNQNRRKSQPSNHFSPYHLSESKVKYVQGYK